ncbi:MAG: hypothetical protein CR982_08320 [Candidatus Cloacimonadota bacterium]|nr:MAG: hypothetical protein CR982_08320 [Candidatus Cloacimonadota bacterium]PIE79057.1 MAG: hypothetical protein CSA15_04765 [Candidatus Delongbacteria bacterium]
MKHYLIFIILLINIPLFPKGGSIVGNIFDREGNPLSGTNITISGTTLGAESNEKGFYYIEPVKKGLYEVKAQFIGYKSENRIVVVEENKRVRVNFFLDSDEMILPETIIIGKKDTLYPWFNKFAFKKESLNKKKARPIFLFKRKKPITEEAEKNIGFFENIYYNIWKIFN